MREKNQNNFSRDRRTCLKLKFWIFRTRLIGRQNQLISRNTSVFRLNCGEKSIQPWCRNIIVLGGCCRSGYLLKEISGEACSCFLGEGQANNPSSQKFTLGPFGNMWLLIGEQGAGPECPFRFGGLDPRKVLSFCLVRASRQALSLSCGGAAVSFSKVIGMASPYQS